MLVFADGKCRAVMPCVDDFLSLILIDLIRKRKEEKRKNKRPKKKKNNDARDAAHAWISWLQKSEKTKRKKRRKKTRQVLRKATQQRIHTKAKTPSSQSMSKKTPCNKRPNPCPSQTPVTTPKSFSSCKGEHLAQTTPSTSDAPSQLDVFLHDGNSFCVDGA